jgi:hypothetical protein
LKILLVAFLFLSSVHLFAQNASDLETISKRAYWLKLLHYDGAKSMIETKEFFLSRDGSYDARSELDATINSFKNDPSTRCRYPARYKWLNSLGLIDDIEDVACKELEMFLSAGFNKISIAYSTERYSAAASLFGHVLLKVDSKKHTKVIEYTAKVPPKTGPLTYAIDGVFGGFVSKYNFFSFFIKDHEAREEEFRDLVLYELDFTQEEIDNILLHLYEVKETTQKYYFMSRNCSSELLTLLDMAEYDSKEFKRSKLFVLPIEVINEYQNKKRIKNITILHSNLKQFEHYYDLLDELERERFQDIVDGKSGISTMLRDNNLSKDSKERLAITALLYYNIIVQNEKVSSNTLSKIARLSKYRSDNSLKFEYQQSKVDENPISAHLYKSSLGYLYKKESYAILGFRNLYKNRFDLLDGLTKNGSVELLDFNIRFGEDLGIEDFTLVHLASMPLSTEFFSEPTKELAVGLKRKFYGDELYIYAEYAFGKRMRVNKNISYALALYGGFYDAQESLLGLGVKTDIEYKLTGDFLVRAGASYIRFEEYRFKDALNEYSAFLHVNKRLSKDFLLRSRIDYFDDNEDYFKSSIHLDYNF